MRRYEFRLDLPSDEYLSYYTGVTQHVIARCSNGQTIQFPASLLRQFVTENGIHGAFLLTCNDTCRGAKLQRLLPSP